MLCAPGMLGTWRSMSPRTAAHVRTMTAVRAADAAAMREVEGTGGEKAPVIAERLALPAPVIDTPATAGGT